MRADEDVDLAAREARRDAAALGRGRAVREQLDAHRPVAEQRPSARHRQPFEQPHRAEVVLLGEHLGRRHERALVAALHRDEQRGERDDGLARTDVALQQAVHRRARRHVVRDLGDRPLLVAGERERQLREELRRRAGRRPSCRMPDSLGLERALARDEPDLHAQELVEDQALLGARRVSAIESGRWMARERDVAVDEVVAIEQRLVERIGEPARRALRERLRRRACAAAT